MATSVGRPIGRTRAGPGETRRRRARPFRWAGLVMALATAALLAACAKPDRGRCLESHLETQYHPTDVFLGGFSGYTHEYIKSEDPECDRWEYPNGRQGP